MYKIKYEYTTINDEDNNGYEYGCTVDSIYLTENSLDGLNVYETADKTSNILYTLKPNTNNITVTNELSTDDYYYIRYKEIGWDYGHYDDEGNWVDGESWSIDVSGYVEKEGLIVPNTPHTIVGYVEKSCIIIEGETDSVLLDVYQSDEYGNHFDGSETNFSLTRYGDMFTHNIEVNGDISVTGESVLSNVFCDELTSSKIIKPNKLLWSGGWFMTADHVARLSEGISEQTNGIVLVFSAYGNDGSGNNKPLDYHFQDFFIPKEIVRLKNNGGHNFPLISPDFAHLGIKYLYIQDKTIAGNAKNIESGTGNGVTYNNAHWVLRYVIGV